tara:strand:- start:1278 stop:2045 length:768 start_codon:yes stop_codon:yes gene_type:complete
VCARDPNAGVRAAAEEKQRERLYQFKADGIQYHNKETTWDKNRKFITGTGYSREYSDIMSTLDTARGKTLAAKEDIARDYFSKQYTDEGGRSRAAGRANRMASYWAKQSDLDAQLNKLYGIGQHKAVLGLKRKTASRLQKNREALGMPPKFGMPTSMPPRDTTGQLLNTVQFALSTAASIATLSDIRLKEDIQQVDISPDGYKIYEFNYKNDPTNTRYRGAMAQDVVKKNPMAVGIRDNYLTVDYSKIDVNMEVV